ncbi:hypothetical protein K2Z83_16730 [Oscillochloris sp. ZM17-4]|uniref:hypothetical protein n=1 Tax=Oscillochloris sp. ZM17-4 TaxID=2866714 RepID=UPI001C732973|nr:hypothetical protein [Oscillochloris sp. ZM17-4]MBX0329318.1 hypothetical protein [Oscillochloris sp. ZM17-4]
MAVIMATFTDSRDAERAAAALRESGFSGATVGTSAGDVGDIVGMGATESSFRNLVVIGSALAGAAALGAIGFLLGMFSMDTPDIRGQGTIDSIGPALTSLVMFAAGLAVVGGIGGLIGGFLSAGMAGGFVRKAVANGEAPRRPLITVPVGSRQQEDVVHEVLRQVGPPFEVIVR